MIFTPQASVVRSTRSKLQPTRQTWLSYPRSVLMLMEQSQGTKYTRRKREDFFNEIYTKNLGTDESGGHTAHFTYNYSDSSSPTSSSILTGSPMPPSVCNAIGIQSREIALAYHLPVFKITLRIACGICGLVQSAQMLCKRLS